MNITKCVDNIPCKNKVDINYEEVAHCTTKEEMVCCIDTRQCGDMDNKDAKDQQTECFIERIMNRPIGKCKFPFIYRGKSHYKCTSKETPNGDKHCYRWCATLLNENNVYIENSGLWGYCSNKCDVNYDETCKKKRKHKKKKASRYKGKHKKGKQDSRSKKKQHQMLPRFKAEHEKEKANPRPEKIEHQCFTRNTTTMVKNRFDGSYEEFTLINPGPCIFPFNYRGEWYSTCIAKDDLVCRLWCSVKNDHGYHRKKGSKWAYCREAGCNMGKNPLEYKDFFKPPCYLDEEKSQIKKSNPPPRTKTI